MKIISLASLKSFLEKNDTIHDALLGMVIDQVSARVEKFLNRNLVKVERTKYYNAGRRRYYLPAYPIDLTKALTVVYDGCIQTLNSDFYVWEETGQIEFMYRTVHLQPKQICITWTGGFTENPIDEVVGSDSLNYRCIQTHVATIANKPITGTEYATYWAAMGTSGAAWARAATYEQDAHLTGIPDDLAQAVLLQCAFVFRKRDSVGTRSISTPDGSITSSLPLDLLPEVKTYLTAHRRLPGEI